MEIVALSLLGGFIVIGLAIGYHEQKKERPPSGAKAQSGGQSSVKWEDPET